MIDFFRLCIDEAVSEWKLSLAAADEEFNENLNAIEKKIIQDEEEEVILRGLINALDKWKFNIEAANEMFFDVLSKAKEDFEEIISLRRLQGERKLIREQ